MWLLGGGGEGSDRWVGRGGECGCWKKLVIGKVKGSCECVVLFGVVVGVGGWRLWLSVVVGRRWRRW